MAGQTNTSTGKQLELIHTRGIDPLHESQLIFVPKHREIKDFHSLNAIKSLRFCSHCLSLSGNPPKQELFQDSVFSFLYPMAIEAWFMDENNEDQRLPHHRNPKEFVSLQHLADLGVLYWHLNPKEYENDEELKKIREARGYSYSDMLDLCPEKVENYEEKLRNFYTEHIHGDEEIRYCLVGSGYFDVRDKDDRWIRIWIKAGDLIVLPAGIYHRFTLDTTNYVKLMRLFVGEPVWTAYNRPQEDHPARKGYIKGVLAEKIGVPLQAY
ncbi:hypothetical protein Vadar_016940 [Vaccinium darrowii]|uniref:Uncharacterized protein n=1 Tax=Vaccinium darrowii TaxID=229202 RepID=A0ACB7YEN3_9ERIC|nr:hypothetical protein Vadar_016940 [Vaccinium darrowii]